MSSLRESLGVVTRPGAFRRYMIGEALSTTGTWMQVMAESWVMTSLTTSALMMGLVTFATGLPVLALTMYGGSLADRFEKRNILLTTQVAQILLATTMGVLVYTQVVQIWHVVAIAALLGIVNAFEMPAVSALVPELVEKHEIGDAMAVDRSSFHTTRLVGPATAGLVIGMFGPAVAFFANAMSFVPLMIALRTIEPRPVGDEEEEAARQTGIMDGVGFVRSDPPTLAMISMMALLTCFPAPVLMVLLPLYTRNVLHLGASGMGFMMSVNAAGALLGSVWLLGVAPDRRFQRLALVSVGVALSMWGLAAFKLVPVAACFLFVLSICLASTFGLVNTIIQERAPDHLRGRVSALTSMTYFGLQPFTALAVTRFADVVGLTHALAIGAPIYAIGALIVLAGPGRRASRPQEAS